MRWLGELPILVVRFLLTPTNMFLNRKLPNPHLSAADPPRVVRSRPVRAPWVDSALLRDIKRAIYLQALGRRIQELVFGRKRDTFFGIERRGLSAGGESQLMP
jgi:hypothetical protein